MNYCTYDTETGEIIKWTSDLEVPAAGAKCMAMGFDARDGYVEGGKFVPKPAQPSFHHRWDPANKAWVDKRSTEDKWAAVKAKRTALLRDSDWVVTRATEEGGPVPKEWRDYRKALRDITLQGDPDNLTWPVPPA